MRDHPLALGFTIYSALALYTHINGSWWRFRSRKRLPWPRAYIMSLRAISEDVYRYRRPAFVVVRLLASLGWPYFFFATWWTRFVKIYRFARFKTRSRARER